MTADSDVNPFKLVDQILENRENEKGPIPDYHSFKTGIPTDSTSLSTLNSMRNKVAKDVTDILGQTPLIRLDKFAKKHGLKCNLLCKAEYMSAGGSIKDRVALSMILKAEEDKLIKPGDIIIEATSGNTGIGLALICAIRGYHCLIIMPKKMSAEKANVLEALGAKLIRTRSSAQTFDSDSHLSIAYWLVDEINKKNEGKFNAVCLDQYKNLGNIEAHYNGTAGEIIVQTDGNIHTFVAGAGTGGTITGIGLRLKKDIPGCRIVGVDPQGSILHEKNINLDPSAPKIIVDKSGYEVEGIGYDFYPSTFRPEAVDEWVITNDRQAFITARDVIKTEGILCGGSSGSALYAALKVGRDMKEGENLVVILPDSIRNYLNKFVSDDWMLSHGIFNDESEHSSFNLTSSHIKEVKQYPIITISTVNSSDSIQKVFQDMQHNKTEWIAVIDEIKSKKNLLGILSRKHIAIDILKSEIEGDHNNLQIKSIVNQNNIFPIDRKTLLKSDQNILKKICIDLLAINRDVTLPPGGGVILVTDLVRTENQSIKTYRSHILSNELTKTTEIITIEDFVYSVLGHHHQ